MITEITPPATIELLSRGMECLIREHFDKMDLQTFVDKASAYAKEKGK